ncbi:phosphate ABC transporter permease PstA [Echinimonas agarilytica]|uniref:Phosphate transport system permease protein PstA n=1 Tax=Echinimonas agarilytica TaxID=1215918 RepID=A0AA42B7W5_9GAMM|nr:phosphate ABC transporter permease PstA [Echinimonas agarilytica]MCM2680169.1 phosphate ABC transporter permease PstA [Echinimonas agarilytica]
MNSWFKSGNPWVWMTAGAVSLSLVAVLGLLLLIAWRGLVFFWPSTIHEFEVKDMNGQVATVVGEIHDRELVPVSQLRESGRVMSGEAGDMVTRYLVKTGNREFVELDFRWILETDIESQVQPQNLAVIERVKGGNFYGEIAQVLQDGQPVTVDLREALQQSIDRNKELAAQMRDVQYGDIGGINHELERIRLKERGDELKGKLDDARIADYQAQRDSYRDEYLGYEKELFALRAEMERDAIVVRDMRGELVTLNMKYVLDANYPNDMGFFSKLGHWFVQVGKFITNEPREANTEGGVFPAIFGTVFMVMLMAVIVTPFGVVAAIYLHEYAGKNALTKIIRTAVINLAGVPSIVYGVFGLGFFVYVLGGSIDELFYAEALPSPTFGTPGMIWSALTLAILTLPVVIVSTEEGLSRIPSSVRQGSLALGATKAETLWRIILPMASPAIMTGLILAVARAAGEVAPLMLVGVVKMAPTLPVDGNFPFVHLDRKFMHLGFHIYDVGFQSPNVEAARPLVYATSFLLVTVIVGLNITAIGIRNHLREKFRSLEH